MKHFIIGLIILSCTGCGSLAARSNASLNFFERYGTYPGLSLDVELLTSKSVDWFIIGIFDVPFSIVFDTLLFPYDYYKDNINICNNHKNEDDIKNEIIGHKSDNTISDLLILQMHQKYDYMLVEYKFDSRSDIFVDLIYRISGNRYNRLFTYRHSDDVDNVNLAKSLFNGHMNPKRSFKNMIDCYKSVPAKSNL